VTDRRTAGQTDTLRRQRPRYAEPRAGKKRKSVHASVQQRWSKRVETNNSDHEFTGGLRPAEHDQFPVCAVEVEPKRLGFVGLKLHLLRSTETYGPKPAPCSGKSNPHIFAYILSKAVPILRL